MYLIIDIGNTKIKAAVFKQNVIEKLYHFKKQDFLKGIKRISSMYTIDKAIVSSVGKLDQAQKDAINLHFDSITLDPTTKLAFTNKYKTPTTLGVDRIALVSAAISEFPNKNVLIIDAGTCVTYDFVTKAKVYLGGAIAPGVYSRYISLHDYTENLPLLDKQLPKLYIGNTTATSIHSGVVNGICREIDGVVAQYKEDYKRLTVVLTGGDAEFLASQLKSSIFVRPFFLVKGLYNILKLNIE